MTRNAIIGLGVGAAATLLLLVTLARPWPAPAQQPAAQTAPVSLPAGYVGAETCKGCHEEAFKKFEATRMGRLFLKQPRNTTESVGCENCHGPGQKHVEAGGGKGVGGMITFAKNDKTPVEKRNAMCTTCHTKGPHLFWQGSAHEARGVACTGCHKVMEEVSPRHQLARATEIETCGTCHLQKRAQQMRSSHMPLREGKMTCTSFSPRAAACARSASAAPASGGGTSRRFRSRSPWRADDVGRLLPSPCGNRCTPRRAPRVRCPARRDGDPWCGTWCTWHCAFRRASCRSWRT